jgi:hypothetical protein
MYLVLMPLMIVTTVSTHFQARPQVCVAGLQVDTRIRVFYTDANCTEGLLYVCKQGSVDSYKPGAKIRLGQIGYVRAVASDWTPEEADQVGLGLRTIVRVHLDAVLGSLSCIVPLAAISA